MLHAKVVTNDYALARVSEGDQFDVMLFGRNKSLHNVVAAWKDGHTEYAREYSVVYNDTEYKLLYPYVCGNWALTPRIALQKPPPPPPPVVIEKTPPPPEPVCKNCPPLHPAYIFPALPVGTPIENADMQRFYNSH